MRFSIRLAAAMAAFVIGHSPFVIFGVTTPEDFRLNSNTHRPINSALDLSATTVTFATDQIPQAKVTGLPAALASEASTRAAADTAEASTRAAADTAEASARAAADTAVANTAAAALASHAGNTANPHAVTKSQVGLGNADNTSDANKPVSTAQQTALDAKASITEPIAATHAGNTANPHAVTKLQVGLGNADNTSDANKPVSTAAQAALDGKQPIDPDLTAIAGVATTSYGRGALALADGPAFITYLGRTTLAGYNITDLVAKTDTANTFVPLQTFNSFNSYSVNATQLSNPGAPSVSNVGTPGATTWTYKIVAKLADGSTTAAGTAGSTTTGNATLDATNKNSLTWSAVTGASTYDVYRTVVGLVPSTTGKIANVSSAAYIDAGAAGDSGTAPATNSTGSIAGANGTFTQNVTVAGTTTSTSTITGPINPTSTSVLNYVDTRWYGVDVTGATVNMTAINNARTAARNAGVPLKWSGVTAINVTLAKTASEVWIGDGNTDDSSPIGGGHVGTKIKWVGASGGIMVTETNTTGGGMEGIALDGNSLAAYCLIVDGITHTSYKQNSFYGFTTGAGIKFLATSHTCSWNTFVDNSIVATGNGVAMLWFTDGASGTFNTCLNTLINTHLQSISGTRPGFLLGNSDNNRLDGTTIITPVGQPGVLVDPEGVLVDGRPNGNVFNHLLTGPGGWVEPTGFDPISPNHIYGYGKTNGEPDPVLGTATSLVYENEYGQAYAYQIRTTSTITAADDITSTAGKMIVVNPAASSFNGFLTKSFNYAGDSMSLFSGVADSSSTGTLAGTAWGANTTAVYAQNSQRLVIVTNNDKPIILAPANTEQLRVSSAGVRIGGTTASTVTKVISANVTWDIPSTADGSYAQSGDLALTGVNDGDTLVVSPSSYYGQVSIEATGPDTIKLLYHNFLGGAPTNPPSKTFRVTAIKF